MLARAALALWIFIFAAPLSAFAERLETSAGPVEVTRMADGLDTPWAIGFLPDDRYLVTERDGRLLLVENGEPRAVEGVPEVWARGQGGLLDVTVPADFSTTGEIFLTYSEPRQGGAGTALAVARLDEATPALRDLRVIFRQADPDGSGRHFGSRVVEAADGTLFLTIGDRGDRDRAQDLSGHQGKVIRVQRNGSVPNDNPFVGREQARPEIWSYGHRNAQAAALGPDGALWIAEHGPRGGDEVNRAEAGANYGWPVQSFGREYATRRRVGTQEPVEGITEPLFYWEVSPAVSGMTVYSGRLFPEWEGDLLVGALQHDTIIRVEVGPDRVREAERLFEDVYPRIRDVAEAPDGAIWFVSDDEGAVYRVAPAPSG